MSAVGLAGAPAAAAVGQIQKTKNELGLSKNGNRRPVTNRAPAPEPRIQTRPKRWESEFKKPPNTPKDVNNNSIKDKAIKVASYKGKPWPLCGRCTYRDTALVGGRGGAVN